MVCAFKVPSMSAKMPRIRQINKGISRNKSHEFSIKLIEREDALIAAISTNEKVDLFRVSIEKRFSLAVNRRVETILNGRALTNVPKSVECAVNRCCWYTNTQIDSILCYGKKLCANHMKRLCNRTIFDRIRNLMFSHLFWATLSWFHCVAIVLIV